MDISKYLLNKKAQDIRRKDKTIVFPF